MPFESQKRIEDKNADKLRSRLAVLNEAEGPEAMNFPGWRLHLLAGELAGHWAVKVDGDWRLTFVLEGEDAVVVDYEDYY